VSEKRSLTNLKLRAALWMQADGKCQSCGNELQPGWHADHIVPWRLSNRTNVHEMQALCPNCNLKKGGKFTMKDRQHVAILKEQLGSLKSSQLPKGRPFKILNHVVPGGGKTATTGVIAKSFPGLKVGIIVPRVSLLAGIIRELSPLEKAQAAFRRLVKEDRDAFDLWRAEQPL
jgi:hypothetical protein